MNKWFFNLTLVLLLPWTAIRAVAETVSLLPPDRFLSFNDYAETNAANAVWRHEGPLPASGASAIRALLPGTNHFHTAGWRLLSCRTGSAAYMGYSIPPKEPATAPVYPAIASNLAANLQNTLGAMIESPVFSNGVGTLYFEAINNHSAYPSEVTVEATTDMYDTWLGELSPLQPAETERYIYNWRPLDCLSLAAASSTDFTRYVRCLNTRAPTIVRIRRSGFAYEGLPPDAAFTVVDNIRVSFPPADVVIMKPEAAVEPGCPSVGTNLTVRFRISHADMNVPTVARAPTLYYRWRFLNQAVEPWRTNDLAYVPGTGDAQGNGECYEAAVGSFSEVGDLEYYVVCAFDGYAYQSPDYTGFGYAYAPESLSPRTYRGLETEGREFSARLRPYPSRFQALYAEADPLPGPVEMTLVGSHEWWALVPIAGLGLTNLTWRFKGTGEYVPGSETFSTGVTYWADSAARRRLPCVGACAESGPEARLSVPLSEGNYVALTLNTETLRFQACRAEYQNFNLWPAPYHLFSESNGQDPKHCYLNTFDAWPTNQQVSHMQAFAGYPSSTNIFCFTPFQTLMPEFIAGNAAYISERTLGDNTVNAPFGVSKFRNVAMCLKGGDGSLGFGYIHNSEMTLPDGLKEVSFKVRLSQTSDNQNIVYYSNGMTNLNYLVRATARAVSAAELSPHYPSVSLIGYYRDSGNFYEYRITQINDPSDSAGAIIDRRLVHQLIKWQNGVASVKAAIALSTSMPPLLSPAISDAAPVELCIFNELTGTRVRCRYGSADRIDWVDTSSPHTCGTFGFRSSDCWSSLSCVRTQATVSGATGTGSETFVLRTDVGFETDVASWFLPATRFQPRADVSPKGIYSVVPPQQIGVYLQPTDYAAGADPEGADSPAWNLVKTVTVNSFAYQTVTLPFSSWQSHFVMLRVLSGAEDVVVDEIKVSSWHGIDNGEDSGAGFDLDWLATESWVVSNASAEAHAVYLDQSRGDPGRDQAIRSPLLETGLGVMEFDFRVHREPAKLTVQYATDSGATDWREVRSFVITNAAGWQHASAYLGVSAPGFFRLLNSREGLYTNACVEINNVTVWDEPLLTNNAWQAYNMKITSTDTNRVALDESKAGFLNNDPYLEASPPQDKFQPFLRSAELPKGLGKLSFYARAYTNNQAATLYVLATTNGWNAPTNQWFEITRFENITNAFYTCFSYEPVDGRPYDAVKLATRTTPGSRRVCLEEVVVTEPVFPGFDIVDVKLLAQDADGTCREAPQPLELDPVAVEARLDSFAGTPSNITVYVSYYTGTNVWGVGNWLSAETGTRRMLPVVGDPTRYRTVPDGTPGVPADQAGGIPGQESGQVVQFCVWATYEGGVPLIVRQETFDNPPWYYPVDLNARHAAQGWSPYYFVYDVPPGAVWINEINAIDWMANPETGERLYGIWDNRYIEIAMPAWMDLAGWNVELVNNDYVAQSVTLPEFLPLQSAVTNGYAFFVIGETGQQAGVPVLPKRDYACQELSYQMPYILPGGLRLRRPMGMVEQAIAYDWAPQFGDPFDGARWAAHDPEGRFVYVGCEFNGGSLGRIGVSDSTNSWLFPQLWTPGAPNFGQQLPFSGDSFAGASNVYVTSVLNGDHGTQNGLRQPLCRLKLRKGMSTNLVIAADDWYRVTSVKKDGVEQVTAEVPPRTYTLPLPEVQQHVNVESGLGLCLELAEQLDSSDSGCLAWILSFAEAPLVPMSHNGRLLSLYEQCWLGVNPTVSNTFDLAVIRFGSDSETNLHLTVRMALNGAKMTSLPGSVLKLRAKTRLSDPEWTLLGQYSLTEASFDSANQCSLVVANPFGFILAGADPKALFLSWTVERQDLRVGVRPLVNEPEP